DWGQPVAVSVPADAVTHAETGLGNQASNVFQRNTADETDCDEGSTTTLYQPFVRRVEILDDDDRNGRWTAGERVSVAADFSENVFVTTEDGVPYVSVTVDDETVQAPYASGSGSSTLVFAHTVTEAQSPVRSMALLADSMTLNDGTITGANGPPVMLRHPGKTREGRDLPAAPRLTAEWEKYPPGHSGDGRKFVVRVLFSEPVNIKARTLRDHALTVVDGDIDTLWQVKDDEGKKRNDLWAIRLMPTSSRDLELALAATTDCDAEGAICTADKRPLSSAISLTVPGPAHEITVADAEVDEGPGAELEFVVSLSEAAPYRVKVDYETEDDTATAGLDYTAVSGQLTFERGETAKTVTVPVLDDDHDDDGETLTLRLSNPTRATIADGEAVGTIRNRDMMPSAWLARFGRTVAEQVLDSVEERISATPRAGVEVKLAGQTGRRWRGECRSGRRRRGGGDVVLAAWRDRGRGRRPAGTGGGLQGGDRARAADRLVVPVRGRRGRHGRRPGLVLGPGRVEPLRRARGRPCPVGRGDERALRRGLDARPRIPARRRGRVGVPGRQFDHGPHAVTFPGRGHVSWRFRREGGEHGDRALSLRSPCRHRPGDRMERDRLRHGFAGPDA
ncbi:MAG: hypothetical protein F4Z55_07340, partial [Boseongicola sp. SB0667_bin_21]|nr:hypothetical protein [Boseongicola sp. SB0667_bin_21]